MPISTVPPHKLISSTSLHAFTVAAFESAQLSPAHATIVADGLVTANLRGVDSHGVSWIPMYLERLDRGLVNPKPDIKTTTVAGAVAHIDADNAMGFIPSHAAMDTAMALARDAGIGMVGVSRSTHFGMGALYVLQALEQNFVSMVFTNSWPAIAMWGGRNAFLGASPVAAGMPGGRSAPFLMDMAMTVLARGKIRLAAMRGEPIADLAAIATARGIPPLSE